MRKLALSALFAASFVFLTAASRPPVMELAEGGLPKCGSDGHICMGSGNSGGAVELGGPVLVDKPILVGPNSSTTVIVIDAGVTIVGSAVVTATISSVTSKPDFLDAGSGRINGNLEILGKVPTLRADVVDAGQLFVQGFGPVTRIIPFTTAATDLASTTTTCTDSGGTTAAGARTGDGCVLGMPSTLTGAGTGLNGNYTCYVSAADTVKVRHCAAGTADDPGSVVYTGFVISSAQ